MREFEEYFCMRYRLCLFLISVIFAFSPLMKLTAENANLAKNPGFEEWGAKPAKKKDWGAKKLSVGTPGRGKNKRAGESRRSGEGELDTERHSGKYAQYLRTTTWGQGAIASGVTVKTGHKYRISVWCKLLSGKFQFGVCFSHKPWTYLGDWVYGKPNATWTRYSKEVVIPKGCVGIATVLFFQSGSGYLDDLEILDLGPVDTSENLDDDKLPLLKGNLVPSIKNKRVAIFNEPDFPTESPRTVKWYDKTLKDAGLEVALLSCVEICDPEKFNRKKYDIILFPTGGFFPDETGIQIETFLASGGMVVIDETMLYRTSPISTALKKSANALKKKFRNGEQTYEFMNFHAKHALTNDRNVFKYDDKEKRWAPVFKHFQTYDIPRHKSYFMGFHLGTWPNYSSTGSYYARPFDVPLKKNPELQNVMTGLPDVIPADLKPERKNGAYRMTLGIKGGFNTRNADELTCNLFLPLYKFPKVSGHKYPSFPSAGTSAVDRDADFYIVRYHQFDKEGGTFVHFGNAGAKLLRSPEGGKVFIETLRLASSQLPDECPKVYVDAVNNLRSSYSEYCLKSLEYRGILAEFAAATIYAGKNNEYETLKAKLKDERSSFQNLSKITGKLNKLLNKRNNGFVYGTNARLKLIKSLEKKITDLNSQIAPLSAKLADIIDRPNKNILIKYPYMDHIYFGMDTIAGRGPKGVAELKKAVGKAGLPFEGYHPTCYRFDYAIRNSEFKRRFASKRLDPKTGTLKPMNKNWFKTTADVDNWRKSYRWQLEKAAKDPRITGIFGLGERSMDWSLWGERTRQLFLKYLEKKYGSIATLNKMYNKGYKSFDDLKLPLKQPQTQPEHALWEDWSRFREVYRRDVELRPMLKTLETHAPNKLFFGHCTYNQHGRVPANGINFYEYGKLMKVNGFEHSNAEKKEFLTFDIASAHSRNLTSEWGATYFPPGPQQEKIDLIKNRLWKGVANGQIGWSLFDFSRVGKTASNYFDIMNLATPMGAELIMLNRKFKFIDHIILDGHRKKAKIRIVYSPTTRRHTSWPGIESDISYRSVNGIYQFFKQAHVQARAIDEQQVMDDGAPKECRLLIIPNVIYQNQKMYEVALKYLENGGNILVTVDSGKFNQYGTLENSWLSLAGVVPEKADATIIPLQFGMKYYSSAHADTTFSLNVLFPEETRILQRYKNGTPALTSTKVGKGRLFVSGVDLAQDCHDQWLGKPAIPMAFLEPVLKQSKIKAFAIIADPTIMIRPWEYEKKNFVFLTDRGASILKKYNLALMGAWKIKDYLMGIPLKSRYDGVYTHISGVVDSPGGVVLELFADTNPKTEISSTRKNEKEKSITVEKTKKKIIFDEKHPFFGRIWASDDKTVLGDFKFDLDVETGGGWGGKTYLTAQYGKEKFRKLCTAGKILIFYFTDKTLTVNCKKITNVYPVNIECSVNVTPSESLPGDCRLINELFYGQKCLTISNGLIRVKILPEMGGRIIEFASLPDATNHLYFDSKAISKGVSSSWSDFGGIEENAGGYPGPYWGAKFNVAILENKPEKIVLKLEMPKAVQWRYGYAKPKSGKNRLIKILTLKKGRSDLTIMEKTVNDGLKAAPTGVRIHPEWRIGGDADPGDIWFAVKNDSTLSMKYPFKYSLPADGRWTAIVDANKRMSVILDFDRTLTSLLYVCSNPKTYNLELFSTVVTIPVKKTFDYKFSISTLRGMSGILSFENGIAGNIDFKGKSILGAGDKLGFDLQVGSTFAFNGKASISILSKGKTVKRLGAMDLQIAPGRALSADNKWDPRGHKDGEYQIAVSIADKSGKEFLNFKSGFQVAGGKQAAKLAEWEKHNNKFKILLSRCNSLSDTGKTQTNLLPARIALTKVALLLAELRSMIENNELDKTKALGQQINSQSLVAEKIIAGLEQ